jgi:hypothetical protein
LSQFANQIITSPDQFGIPDPSNLHYDDTDEEAAEFARKFRELLAGKLTDLLYDAEHGLIEAEQIEELSKNMVNNYFDKAAQSRGKLEKASDNGDEVAGKKLAKRDQGLDHAWKKMHEEEESEDEQLEEAQIESPEGDVMTQTKLQARPEGNEEDFVNAVARRCGWAVTQQCEDIFAGQALEEQNSNALKYIAEIARGRGEDELADELETFINGPVDEAQGEDSGLTLPGDAGDAFIADVTKPAPHGEGEYTVYGKTFSTKTFNSDDEANAWLEQNPDHGVLGVKDHQVHVAHMDEELQGAMGMERILKLSGQKR